MEGVDQKSTSSNLNPNCGPSTRSTKRGISLITTALPSARASRKQKIAKDNKSMLAFINKTAEEALQKADSFRSKRTVEDYSYVIRYATDASVQDITLPSDFDQHVNDIDRLIAFLIATVGITLVVEDSKITKVAEEVPDVLKKYASGIITAFASEATLPTVWKEKDQPMEIAKQAILWKRFEGWFDHKGVKPTHAFRFCHPTISGSGEKTSFSRFYTLLAQQSGEYSGQRAKLIKTLIQLATSGHAVKEVRTVLDAHKISKAEICRAAKPQTEDKTKKRRKNAPKSYVTKQLWDPETFPFLSQCEKNYLKSLKSVFTSNIKTATDAWERLGSVEQYLNYKVKLQELKDLYQKYYQEVDRISTRLHRRRMLFESYLRKNKLAEPKGTKLLKSTVAHFETQKARPTNDREFAFVMDPRNVLQPAAHHRFTNPEVGAGDGSDLWNKVVAVCEEFKDKYPDYETKHYTDNVMLCKTTNIFDNLTIEGDIDHDENMGEQSR